MAKPYKERKEDMIAAREELCQQAWDNAPTKLNKVTAIRRPGRPRLYEPHQIIEKMYEYLLWCYENPLYESKSQFNAKDGEWMQESVPKMRIATVRGFRVWLGVSKELWFAWGKHEEFFHHIIQIEEALNNQNLEGGAAGLLNASLVAKLNGLTDKVEHSGPEGGPIETKEISDLDLAKFIALQLAKAAPKEI